MTPEYKRLLAEIQYKQPDSNLSRANVGGALGVASINNIFKQNKKKKPKKKSQRGDLNP